MHKFILGENPMRPETSGLWVIHLRKPISIIRCTRGHVEIDSVFQHYQYRNSAGKTEEWTLSAYHFFTTDPISEPEKQVATLLNKAWRWFRAYLESEDKNIDTDERAQDN